MKIFYFTGTGNSLAVAKKIGGELISIPKIINDKNIEYEDNVIGLVFPTYCCNIPRIVREFLDKASLKAKYLFAIATYGNSMGSGGDGSLVLEFDKYTKSKNLKFNYINSILMVDNFIDVFNIEKEIKKIASKEIEKNLNNIVKDIQDRRNFIKNVGISAKVITKMCVPISKNQDKGETSKKFLIDENCIKCGTCKKVCPRDNIKIDTKVEFKNNCEGCYACIHACPQKVIHIKNEKSNARWINEDVTLKEIINSNNQR